MSDYMELIGVDRGTTYTKNDRGRCFRSTVKAGEALLNDCITVEYQGKKWIVGERGSYSTDLMKSESEHTKMLVLLSIAQSSQSDEVYLVTGLPIGMYTKQKVAMKGLFDSTVSEITVNGKQRMIHIKKAEVFPEAAGVFYSQNFCRDALIIDIGGLSVDVALFERENLIKYSTYPMGVMKLYSKIANNLNSRYDLSKTEWDIENVLQDGLSIHGNKVELNIDNIISEHVREIFERLSLEYDFKTIDNVLFAGGASELLAGYFDIPQLQVVRNSQFANAIGYRKIGEMIFK